MKKCLALKTSIRYIFHRKTTQFPHPIEAFLDCLSNWNCRQCSLAVSEQVPLSPLGWYLIWLKPNCFKDFMYSLLWTSSPSIMTRIWLCFPPFTTTRKRTPRQNLSEGVVLGGWKDLIRFPKIQTFPKSIFLKSKIGVCRVQFAIFCHLTLPRRGYRFCGSEGGGASEAPPKKSMMEWA